MTFAELYAKACAVNPSDSICISVECWRHVPLPGDAAENFPKWTIYSAALMRHFSGGSAEEALRAYKLASPVVVTDDKRLNGLVAVGEIPASMPTVPEEPNLPSPALADPSETMTHKDGANVDEVPF